MRTETAEVAEVKEAECSRIRPYSTEEVDTLLEDLNRFEAWRSGESRAYHARPWCSRGGSARCRHLPFYVATFWRGKRAVRLTLCPTHARMFARNHGLDFPEIEV